MADDCHCTLHSMTTIHAVKAAIKRNLHSFIIDLRKSHMPVKLRAQYEVSLPLCTKLTL